MQNLQISENAKNFIKLFWSGGKWTEVIKRVQHFSIFKTEKTKEIYFDLAQWPADNRARGYRGGG